ncbi:hypothetical protein QYF61_017241 [Mycteria americana]|uniref:Uncharacterized protein n=1 Tax=Mycteria americana TaxID=33587 RepID=A0AAN7N2E4_MYCAM|nr:hypothetical protein QYF61_017241 [Mycteria americana]
MTAVATTSCIPGSIRAASRSKKASRLLLSALVRLHVEYHVLLRVPYHKKATDIVKQVTSRRLSRWSGSWSTCHSLERMRERGTEKPIKLVRISSAKSTSRKLYRAMRSPLRLLLSKLDKPRVLSRSSQDMPSSPSTSFVALFGMHSRTFTSFFNGGAQNCTQYSR